MAFYSLISYYDPAVEAWTVPQAIQGADEEAIKTFRQGLERTMRAGRIDEKDDGVRCFRVGVFDDDTGKIFMKEQPEHIIDLKYIKKEKAEAVA